MEEPKPKKLKEGKKKFYNQFVLKDSSEVETASSDYLATDESFSELVEQTVSAETIPKSVNLVSNVSDGSKQSLSEASTEIVSSSGLPTNSTYNDGFLGSRASEFKAPSDASSITNPVGTSKIDSNSSSFFEQKLWNPKYDNCWGNAPGPSQWHRDRNIATDVNDFNTLDISTPSSITKLEGPNTSVVSESSSMSSLSESYFVRPQDPPIATNPTSDETRVSDLSTSLAGIPTLMVDRVSEIIRLVKQGALKKLCEPVQIDRLVELLNAVVPVIQVKNALAELKPSKSGDLKV